MENKIVPLNEKLLKKLLQTEKTVNKAIRKYKKITGIEPSRKIVAKLNEE